jgi:hypothetical protein
VFSLFVALGKAQKPGLISDKAEGDSQSIDLRNCPKTIKDESGKELLNKLFRKIGIIPLLIRFSAAVELKVIAYCTGYLSIRISAISVSGIMIIFRYFSLIIFVIESFILLVSEG